MSRITVALLTLGVVVFMILFSTIKFLNSLTLFDVELKKVYEISDLRFEGDNYVVFSIRGNASSQDVLSIRDAQDEESIIWQVERFDSVIDIHTENTYVSVILFDDLTGNIDTFNINDTLFSPPPQ